MEKSSNKPRKVLSVFSLVMINVIAVDSLRTLPLSAEYGFSLVFFYILAAIVFFLPIAFVAAELATGWPETGGIYVWVREAFGNRWAFFTIWLQWIYNVVWYPTILAFIAATLAYIINPHLANDKTYLLMTVLTIFWGATIANCFGMRLSSWVSTIGAIFGTIIPMVFIIILGAIWIYSGKHIQINFSWHSFFPNLKHIDSLVFLAAVLFGLIGMEMSAVHAEEVENPQRDYPRASFYSTIIIIASLTLASLAIALVVPQKQLSLVSGLIDAFAIFFNAYHMPWMIPVIAVLIIIGAIACVSAWIIGPTKGLLIASRDADLIATFQHVNKYGAPVAILILQAVIFTVLCSIFLLMPTVNSSYWILSDLTAQLALMVYVMMFTAAIYLRYKFPEKKRAYTIPGGNIMMWIIAGMGLVTCLATITLGFFPPSQINIGSIWVYEALLWGGIIVLSVPALFVHKLKTENKS